MTRIYIDTEFSDFTETQLISFGAVAEDGQEFYVELCHHRYLADNELSGKRNCEGQLSCPANAKSLRRYPSAVEIGDEWVRAVPSGRR